MARNFRNEPIPSVLIAKGGRSMSPEFREWIYRNMIQNFDTAQQLIAEKLSKVEEVNKDKLAVVNEDGSLRASTIPEDFAAQNFTVVNQIADPTDMVAGTVDAGEDTVSLESLNTQLANLAAEINEAKSALRSLLSALKAANIMRKS